MKISRASLTQFILALLMLCILFIITNNLIVNLYNSGIGFSLNWLFRPSGFALAESSLPYKTSDSYLWILFIGWINTIKVVLTSLILSTIIGIFAGVSRFANNSLIRIIASLYVSFVRQTPLLLQLMFWYFVIILGIDGDWQFPYLNDLSLSNKGLSFFGNHLSSEFLSLLLGLSVFTGAYISEVIRGGLNSVPVGQWEALKCLGISEFMGFIKVIIPQSLPAILPGLTSQYLNLAKNSTLAIAVGYADIYAITDTTINQTGRAIEAFIIMLISFLLFNLIITYIMEHFNNIILSSGFRN